MSEINSMKSFLETVIAPFIRINKTTRAVDLDCVRANNSQTSLKRHIERETATKIRLQIQSDYNLDADWLFENDSLVTIDEQERRNQALRHKATKLIKHELENGPLYHFNKRRLFGENNAHEVCLLAREGELLDFEDRILDSDEIGERETCEKAFLFHSIMFMGSMLEKLSKDEILIKKHPKQDIGRLRKVVDVALEGATRIFANDLTAADVKATPVNIREHVMGVDKFWHKNKNITAHIYMHKKLVKIGLIMNYLKMSILDYLNSFWRINLKNMQDVENNECEPKDNTDPSELFKFEFLNAFKFLKKNNLKDKGKPLTQRLLTGSLECYLDYTFWETISSDERTSIYPKDFILDFLKTVAKRIVLKGYYYGESPLVSAQIDRIDYMLDGCEYDVCNILFYMEVIYAQNKLKYYKFEKIN